MVPTILFFISLVQVFLKTRGQSTQLVGPGPICSSDVASYHCTKSGGAAIITWTVMLTCGGDTGRSFGLYNKIGTMFNVTQCNSVLSFNLTSITSSSISSTLTIHRPLPLNGTRITCVDETTQLVLKNFSLIPPSTVIINGTSYGDISNFSMTWQPQDDKRDFTVIVYPNQTFNNTTPITFQYEHVIPFTISIIQHDCTEDITTTFLLNCSLLNDNVTYIVHVNGNMSARLETSEGEKKCINNEWTVFSSTTDNNVMTRITSSSSTSPSAPVSAAEGISIGLVGIIAGIGVSFLAIGTILIVTVILWRYHLHRVKIKGQIGEAQNYNTEDCPTEGNDDIYTQLNNRHARAGVRVQNDREEYSTLNQNIQPAFRGATHKNRNPGGYDAVTTTAAKSNIKLLEYETLDNTTSSSNEAFQGNSATGYSTLEIKKASGTIKMKLKYTDVSVAKYESHKPNLIHNTVNYSIIDVRVRPEDKRLDLDSLIMQLRPMEEHYKQFGVRAGIPTAMLDAIESSSLKAYDALVEVCDYWLRKCKEENITPTWRIIAEILSLIGQYQLSHDLLEVYQTGKLPTEVDRNSMADNNQPPPLPPPINPEDLFEDQDGAEIKAKALEVETPPLPPKLSPKAGAEQTPQAVPARPPKPKVFHDTAV